MILSILICTLEKRKGFLKTLLESLHKQMCEDVEILQHCDNGEMTTGAKRNKLVSIARGKYVVFVDDDDAVAPDYIPSIIEAAKNDSDAIVFNGTMTTDGSDEKKWYISKDLPYKADTEDGKVIYLRYPNHIVPIKREIALQVKFQDIRVGEDYLWATAIHDRGLIKTETKIDKLLYHYQYITNK